MTHPFHPRFGDTLEVAYIRHNWGFKQVYYIRPGTTSQLDSMPISWTDAGVVEPFQAISAGRSAFCVSDLLELSQMIESLQEGGDQKC